MKNSKKLKNQFGWGGPVVVIFCNMSCCQPFWMKTITKNYKITIMALLFNIEACNKNKTPPNLGQSSP